jgi:hypothetical protein
MIVLSLAGLVFLWRASRAWTIFAGTAIGLQLLINGAALDWHGGDSYGMRRMTELYPVYVLLACALLGKWRGAMQIRPTRFRWVTTRAILLAMIPLAGLYLYSFYVYTWSDTGRFSSTPQEMIDFYLNHPNREEFSRAVLDGHVGPPAWPRPGP